VVDLISQEERTVLLPALTVPITAEDEGPLLRPDEEEYPDRAIRA
jgi:hypothetical protein